MWDFSCIVLRLATAISAASIVGQAVALEPAKSIPPASADRTPALRLAQPHWLPLTAEQIRALFADRGLAMDEGYQPLPGAKIEMIEIGGCWPSEIYFADGQWQRHMCSRGPREFAGRWYTEKFRGGERLCVEASDFPKRCRFVWLGDAPNRVIMAYAGLGASGTWEDPAWFNPYILTKLSSQQRLLSR